MSERHYRRLLWAYPRAYRSRHGDEMVTTLLDMAESGRRPGLGLSAHLVLCGLRQRFRLPARRPLAWLAALLAAVALGAFGAAAGTWLGWQTAVAVPSDGELRALNAAMTGMPAPAAVYREPSAMKGPGALVRADGTSDYSAERARAALLADGWRITSFRETDGAILANPDPGADTDLSPETDLSAKARFDALLPIPTKFLDYTATKGDLKLQGDGSVIVGGAELGLTGQAMWATEVWPLEAVAVRPLTVAGAVVGVLAGWLLAAAAAYRLRGTGRPRRWLATVLSAAGLAALAVPVYELYRDAYQVLVYAHGSPYPYIVDGPDDGRVTLFCTVVGLLAIVIAVAAARPAGEGREIRA
ncbi:hypothetical protein ACQPZX_16760 [Actinoplanes sp. CA-142083]|uniref:hypothetical protein n=1 Tax=Actinoplanes sp. CA-142083 TaxID=3239903 RepID=UPI003D8C2250